MYEKIRLYVFFFFFQAEDGIRDDLVTGVQTCALPISRKHSRWAIALQVFKKSNSAQKPMACCTRSSWNPTALPASAAVARVKGAAAERNFPRPIFTKRFPIFG